MSRLTVPVNAQDHVQGREDAAITLVEYGDFQCPYCGMAHPVIKTLQKRLGERLRFVFRHFPLTSSHPFAELAAEASEAAGAQGKFWQMHDGIYENQDDLGQELLLELARRLNLDMNAFIEHLESRKFHARIKKDFMSGVRSGVNGTPGLFINDLKYEGPLDAVSLGRAMEQQLRRRRLTRDARP